MAMRDLKVMCAALAGILCVLYGTCPRAETNSEQQDDPWGGAVYLEILGRAFFFGSIHLELPIVDDLAVELGGAMAPGPSGIFMLFMDAGLSYRVWSSGRSSAVLGASLCYQGNDTTQIEDRRWVGAASVALGAFYEFRDGVVVRLGLEPQIVLWKEDGFFMYWFGTGDWYDYFQFAALQVGWAF